ncbi:hypothetical protein A3F62_01635 [Candidatus Woesebacteria bacterium RIFCSPHIGHO2_12_FULL_44_11]|uniref:RNA helicase n=1 Tax=Candidatus Woesebacteria bacterium RIFCSPLOWO2_01_FULL_44_14 TaxID=1802525 RepID=A0A1F8C000_9BACT|nr:MAG: hypothetical protein A3F62_01635 [Candidatus Woesebacteria bacterium RIFCSPHIGHO2_12_FULL_44_11]OGM69657.1 MAG: hypothetical protein A2975_00920 [Candidatus Woesebacteria bacterium RIFCSPLOWO2_01_FULL_44_14]
MYKRREFNQRRIRTFDPSRIVSQNGRTGQPEEKYVPVHKFSDFALHQQLKQNVTTKGFSEPTPIQDQVIPALLAGKDVTGIAATGTGKTAAFLLPLINKVFANKREKVLIITPTRELAVQIDSEFRTFARSMNLYSCVCIGGASIGRQIGELRRNPNFVIGTPGRLLDLERRHALRFGDYGSVVLDEVDRMLDMGFIPDVKHIISLLPSVRQAMFFSATLPDKIRDIIASFVKDPVVVTVHPGEAAVNVDQEVIRVGGRQKTDLLQEMLSGNGFEKVLVFGRTKHGIDKLAKFLYQKGRQVEVIHGNKSQNQRQRALEKFRNNGVQVLLATDVASRGLDIDNVTHVINYDLPETYEAYIHRIGRTGRADKKGTALTFI